MTFVLIAILIGFVLVALLAMPGDLVAQILQEKRE